MAQMPKDYRMFYTEAWTVGRVVTDEWNPDALFAAPRS